MTKTSAVLRKLSPNAAKNWHQNSGAKRRVVISDMDMFEPGFAGALAPFLFPAVRLARPYATRQWRLLAFSLAAGGGLGDAGRA